MKNLNQNKSFRYMLGRSLIVLLILLASCTTTPAATETPTAAQLPATEALSPLPTFTPTITQHPFPTLPQPPAQPFLIDRLRMVYEKDGNIYLQDGFQAAKKLTFHGDAHEPRLSTDGGTILFYRGETKDNLYSIQADGTKEILLIETKILRKLSRGEVKGITFIPNSTKILFNTYLCNDPLPGAYDPVECVVGLYQVDFLTGETHRVVTGLSGNRLHDKNFSISPNGQFLSVAASGHVDLYIASGFSYENIKQDVITYFRTRSVEYLATQYWLPDSSGFVAVIANSGYYGLLEMPNTFATYRYTFFEERGVFIPLDPQIGANWRISPDRNWVIYDSYPSRFLGNLNTGHTQKFPIPYSLDSFKWSPGSRYVTFGREIYSLDGSQIAANGEFLAWLDSTHYIYTVIDSSSPQRKNYIGEIGGESIPIPDTFVWSGEFVILGP